MSDEQLRRMERAFQRQGRDLLAELLALRQAEGTAQLAVEQSDAESKRPIEVLLQALHRRWVDDCRAEAEEALFESLDAYELGTTLESFDSLDMYRNIDDEMLAELNETLADVDFREELMERIDGAADAILGEGRGPLRYVWLLYMSDLGFEAANNGLLVVSSATMPQYASYLGSYYVGVNEDDLANMLVTSVQEATRQRVLATIYELAEEIGINV